MFFMLSKKYHTYLVDLKTASLLWIRKQREFCSRFSLSWRHLLQEDKVSQLVLNELSDHFTNSYQYLHILRYSMQRRS